MKQLRNQQKQSAHWWNRSLQVRATPVPSPTYLPPQRIAPVAVPSPEPLPERDSWQEDEHWMAVTAHVAGLDFPNEG